MTTYLMVFGVSALVTFAATPLAEAFAEAMGALLKKPKEWLENAPYSTPVRRLDELRANKHPKLTYFDEG